MVNGKAMRAQAGFPRASLLGFLRDMSPLLHCNSVLLPWSSSASRAGASPHQIGTSKDTASLATGSQRELRPVSIAGRRKFPAAIVKCA